MTKPPPAGRACPPSVDVVLLSGVAAEELATELAVGPYGPDQGTSRRYDLGSCLWLAVASTRGTVVGVALARRRAGLDGGACELLTLEVSGGADEEHVKHRLGAVVRPLFSADPAGVPGR